MQNNTNTDWITDLANQVITGSEGAFHIDFNRLNVDTSLVFNSRPEVVDYLKKQFASLGARTQAA